MSRFRTLKSKGRFYVVTTDSNGLAGGPYDSINEAEGRRDELAALDAKQAEAAKRPEAHRMNITPGYRSPDVEDGRAAPRPNLAAAFLMPPRWVKWNTPDRQPLDPAWVPPWKVHRLPVEMDPEAARMLAEPPMSAPPPRGGAVVEPPPLARATLPRSVPPWARTLKP